ncbi:MAG: anti-sigma factor family protein [Blastocatellia bacterium]
MKTDDLENKLRSLKLIHLTESALTAYCDQELDHVSRALAEAHIKQCFICARKVELLREEDEALQRREISAEDVALVERLMAESHPRRQSPAARPVTNAQGIPAEQRLTEYLRPMIASWQTFFSQQAAPHLAGQGEEIWQWQSEDGYMRARAMLETSNDLTIHFSSSEMQLEGARLHVRLGPIEQQTTMRRVSDSEVYAKVAVPRQQPREMAALSIKASQGGEAE